MVEDDKIAVIRVQKMPTGTSDVTMKSSILPLDNVLQQVLALRPVTWRWKATEDDVDLQYGFIAQEVEEVLPNLVGEARWRDGTQRKHLVVTDMIPYLVGAIKEQQQQIEQLRADVVAARRR